MSQLFAPFFNHPSLFLASIAWLGLVAGSFLNVVIHRVPVMLEREWNAKQDDTLPAFNLWIPRSRCPHCGHHIRAIENIPVISYLLLRGRCSSCTAKISARYPLVEAGTALLSVVIAYQLGPTSQTVGMLVVAWWLIALAGIDHDTEMLPDMLTLPLLWLGLAFNLCDMFVPLKSAVIGAIAGYGLLWALFWAMKLATGRETLGHGDFKLVAALGAWFGWQILPGILMLASLLALVSQLPRLLRTGGNAGGVFPFGPSIAGAAVVAVLGGNALTSVPFWRMITFH